MAVRLRRRGWHVPEGEDPAAGLRGWRLGPPGALAWHHTGGVHLPLGHSIRAGYRMRSHVSLRVCSSEFGKTLRRESPLCSACVFCPFRMVGVLVTPSFALRRTLQPSASCGGGLPHEGGAGRRSEGEDQEHGGGVAQIGRDPLPAEREQAAGWSLHGSLLKAGEKECAPHPGTHGTKSAGGRSAALHALKSSQAWTGCNACWRLPHSGRSVGIPSAYSQTAPTPDIQSDPRHKPRHRQPPVQHLRVLRDHASPVRR